MVESEIRRLLKEYFEPMNFTIDPDGYVNVNGNCKLRKRTKSLPVKFRHASGAFYCSGSRLISLEGSPQKVDGSFNCSFNYLTTLKGGPDSVMDNFDCGGNELTSLEGLPQIMEGNLYCENNPLKSLDGLPASFKGMIRLDYDPSMPVLRLLRCDKITFYNCGKNAIQSKIYIEDILNKFCGPNFSRSNILQCQRELIQNGFEGNASW